MTPPCDHFCPLGACPSCPYAGGEIPTAATVSAKIAGSAGQGTAPEVREHLKGLTPGTYHFDLGEGGKPMAATHDTPVSPGGAR